MQSNSCVCLQPSDCKYNHYDNQERYIPGNSRPHQALTTNALAESFEVSRQAISKHLQILTECGLIVGRQEGRERHYEARLDRLKDVTHWIEQQQKVWTARFDWIDKLLNAESKKSGKHK